VWLSRNATVATVATAHIGITAEMLHSHYRDGMEERFSLINRRLALLEQQVRLLSERAGVPCPTFGSDVGTTAPSQFEGGVPAEVVALARAGNAIAAIKLYRELTGAGLREAKEIVESL
jgi:large subunit ribosomal protein L7/L12